MSAVERYVVRLNESVNRFEVETDGEISYIDYRWYNQTLILLYIFVPPAYRGKGISTVLIKYALDYATTKEVKIKVFCPYIAKYIRVHLEYQGLLE